MACKQLKLTHVGLTLHMHNIIYCDVRATVSMVRTTISHGRTLNWLGVYLLVFGLLELDKVS